MRPLTTGLLTITAAFVGLAALAIAQRPEDGPGRPGRAAEGLVARMLAFDKDGDGKLARTEVTDERLHRLFDRADADRDGTVTRAELTALAEKAAADDRGGPPGFMGGPPGFMGAPPRPGEVLPAMLQQRLRLTDEQKTQVAELQKEVDARLAKILDEEQREQLKTIRERGPGGFGPPGGRGRPGGPRPGPDGDRPPPRDRP